MDLVDQQLKEVRTRYPAARADRRPDGTVLIIIPRMPLPPGWSRPEVDVWFVVPLGYPVASPDTFWTQADLRLWNGGFPANTQLNANYGGSELGLWFSVHPSAWNPNRDNLLTYVRLIESRLREAQ